jgi:hypothetical protein
VPANRSEVHQHSKKSHSAPESMTAASNDHHGANTVHQHAEGTSSHRRQHSPAGSEDPTQSVMPVKKRPREYEAEVEGRGERSHTKEKRVRQYEVEVERRGERSHTKEKRMRQYEVEVEGREKPYEGERQDERGVGECSLCAVTLLPLFLRRVHKNSWQWTSPRFTSCGQSYHLTP